MLEHVFVYGTLKRGERRVKCWPKLPAQIQIAWALGNLYDLGSYPAMVPGQDRILGELWSFDEVEMADVLVVLDEVEGANRADGLKLYNRDKIAVHLEDGTQHIASTYFYANPQKAARFSRRWPSRNIGGQLYAVWP